MSSHIGKTYGTLTVLDARTARTAGGNPKQLLKLRCTCGRVFERAIKSLQRAKNPTCRACYEAPKPKKFGNQHPLYDRWAEMIRRCTDPKRPKYPLYGGRGITVCDRWSSPESGFKSFVEDMGRPPTQRHTLDRVDNDGPYSPENCRWATPEEQYANSSNPDPDVIDLGGHKKTLYGWAHLLNLSEKKIYERAKRGGRTPKEVLLDVIAARYL